MKTYLYILIACNSLFLCSCKEVIDIDLNSASPQIVIEGNIHNLAGPYLVTISKTVNYSDDNTFPAINNAFVTISDQNEMIDTLIQNQSGMYYTTKIQGQPLSTYTLKVIIDNKTYISQSTMPKVVTFDSLTTETSASFGGKKSINAIANYQDPVAESNYYRFVKNTNNGKTSSFVLQNDTYNNGNYIHKSLRENLKKGDVLKVEMCCIDKYVYQYFYNLNQNSGGLGGTSTPSNPESNISGGCLGFFNAHCKSIKTIIGQ